MHSLATIHKLNASPPTRASVETRESSAVRTRGGVVVHSARLRSTAFVLPEFARKWWTRWEAASTAKRHRMADAAVLEAGENAK